jgi:hypothetical protein
VQVIQRLIVGFNPPRVFEVGGEYEGRGIIEIKNYSQDEYSSYSMYDENSELIAIIENAPVIVEYRQIAEHDAEDVTELKAAAGTTASLKERKPESVESFEQFIQKLQQPEVQALFTELFRKTISDSLNKN